MMEKLLNSHPPFQCASFSRNDPLWNRRTVTHYHHPSWTDDGSFRASLDDAIIIPFVFVGLAASKILRFILSLLMRLFDYAFTLAMQLVWLPLFAAKVLGEIVAIINGVLRSSTFQDEIHSGV